VDTVHECDGRTDGRTDRITITKTVQRIASHGKNECSTKISYSCASLAGLVFCFIANFILLVIAL